MKIELFPLEKITIDGYDIFLGQSKKQFIDCLGQPEVIYENYGDRPALFPGGCRFSPGWHCTYAPAGDTTCRMTAGRLADMI